MSKIKSQTKPLSLINVQYSKKSENQNFWTSFFQLSQQRIQTCDITSIATK